MWSDELSPALILKQGSQPHFQLRDVAMAASHRVAEDPPSAWRLLGRHRRRIVQALLKLGCGDLSIRQHPFLKN